MVLCLGNFQQCQLIINAVIFKYKKCSCIKSMTKTYKVEIPGHGLRQAQTCGGLNQLMHLCKLLILCLSHLSQEVLCSVYFERIMFTEGYMCTISKAWMLYLQVYWQSCIYIGSHDKCKLNCDTTAFLFKIYCMQM